MRRREFLLAGIVAGCAPLGRSAPGFAVCGGVTSSSFRVRGRGHRLAVWAGGSEARLFDASFEATGLRPNTSYQYALETGGDFGPVGQVRTHPKIGQAHSFTVAMASCADGRYDNRRSIYSNSPIFRAIAAHNPLLYICTGDFGYPDIDANDLSRYRALYDGNFSMPNQRALYRSCAFDYVWDDHDFGPNNSFKNNPGKPAAQAAYRERMPHYPLPAASIYHSFQIGRVLFIVTDLRSERDDPKANDPAKSILGGEQKRWFKALLAKTSAKGVVWVSSSPWIAEPGIVDSWGEFTSERDEMAASIHQYMKRGLFCIVGGDIHSLAIDDGSNNRWGGFPVFQFAALDGRANFRGGPYSHGTSPGVGRYGLLKIKDDGRHLEITGTGYIGRDEWRSHSLIS